MAAITTRNCPKCGGSLTPNAGDSGRRTCSGCGASFSVRTKPVAIAARPAAANDFAHLGAPTTPAPRRVPATPRPAPATNPRLVLGLVVVGALAVVLLGLTTAIVLAVNFWPRPAAQPTAVAVAPVNAPIAPAAHGSGLRPCPAQAAGRRRPEADAGPEEARPTQG